MNKKIKVILISMVCLLICSVQITGLDVSEKKLRSTIEVLNSNNILAVYSGDYDKDGSEEAFVEIRARCVIGAGSVVTRSLPPDSLAVGNPARVIRRLNNRGE